MGYKVIKDRTLPNKRDSLFYKATEHDPLKVVEYNGRQFQIEPFGEVEIDYEGSIYRCASEISSIKSDEDLIKAEESGELYLIYNNWYEVRPVMDNENTSPYYRYVNEGVYDDIFFDPDDLDEHLCRAFIEAEKLHDQVEKV